MNKDQRKQYDNQKRIKDKIKIKAIEKLSAMKSLDNEESLTKFNDGLNNFNRMNAEEQKDFNQKNALLYNKCVTQFRKCIQNKNQTQTSRKKNQHSNVNKIGKLSTYNDLAII